MSYPVCDRKATLTIAKICYISCHGIPDSFLRIHCAPNVEHPFSFSATIKSKDVFDTVLTGETQASFLGQLIASGDWYGVLCTVYKPSGEIEDTIHLYGKVTWQKLLKGLYKLHPTGSNMEIAPKDDEFSELYWEYFNVDIYLLWGDEVTQ